MKKWFWVPLLAVLAAILLIGAPVAAQDDELTLPDPGLTPDSPLYFLDNWGKQISLAFTFNAQNKVNKALGYANERMAEMEAMMAQNKVQQAAKAMEGYEDCLQTAEKHMEQARQKGVDVSDEVALTVEKHLNYMNNRAGTTTEDEALMTQARERAMVCQETAVKTMAKGDPEKAAQFNLQLMERQLNRIQTQAEEPAAEGLQARLEVFNRLGNLGEDISGIAEGLGEETTVDQLVGMATAHHLEVLSQVQERVQGQAQEAVQSAIQNCVENHEQLVTRLQARNQMGQVPSEAPLPGRMEGQGGTGSSGNGQMGK